MQVFHKSYRSLTASKYRHRGQSIAEFGPALWLMFVGILFPMFILASVSIRFALFHAAAYMSCRAAIQSKNFLHNYVITYGSGLTNTNYSAINAARMTAQNFKNGFNGLNYNPYSTDLSLYIVNIVYNSSNNTYTQTVNSANTPLSQPSNSGIDEIRLVLRGTITPLISMPPGGLFNNIPGLTAPLNVVASEQMLVENQSGLTD